MQQRGRETVNQIDQNEEAEKQRGWHRAKAVSEKEGRVELGLTGGHCGAYL